MKHLVVFQSFSGDNQGLDEHRLTLANIKGETDENIHSDQLWPERKRWRPRAREGIF